ncbi:MAG: hypothetical protein IM584_11065 [Chitinophagaceae bacterium]|nr:hypothetical protein [Chitinophagaceae bacterium]MEA3424743.1 hypothetical protein [Bacteroidota bacterium]MCA6452369.1 hypothetical protein [Chitinophagaceae bacterium]MCA6456663.1 hypothetical protein [Chitinophagaceae bacterium]MCA6458781.1 hypothetical protein [Chitinophagaceae bacterium]
MQKWKKMLAIIGIIGVLAAGAVVLYVYLKPHRDVAKEKAVQLTAQALFDAFKTNETEANAKYLDKAIELNGEVADITKNQEGRTVVNFKTNDPLFVINCTFKEDPGVLQPGQTITFKGICTGYIPDMNIVINEGVLVK